MKTEKSERRRTLLWALPASLVLHALITAFLVYGLPVPAQQPQEEQAVNVALVPPPEQPKPKPAPAPPPPPPGNPSEQKVEKQAPEKLPPIEVLRPVFQFGDKDTGPKKSLDGGSAQDNAPSPPKDNEPQSAVAPKNAESKPASAPDAGEPTESAKTNEKPEADKQEAATPPSDKQASAAAMPLAAPGDDGEIELPASAQAPRTKPENVPKPRPAKATKSGRGITEEPNSTDVAAATPRPYSGLPGVRKLFSQGATGDVFATNSMADVPRDQRAARLCASVLEQELNDASYSPQLIPSIPLKAGNVLDAPDTAFRTATTWYHLSFRCGIDINATRVTSFAFRVGAAASPDESAFLDRDVRRRRGPG
ncbi:DUF930 domain-containing protein [Mesorhizobium sp. LSJC264A00]|uniref:DUF930 domain-containing protein n=1 Tax=unclassified Mesorhizobium TaxID=325217 RepID=UPI0003CF32D2|nr:DUF930 domain-containing protein [Mesorhizobium sp. LSJC264A00]ESX18724.1 hypothetical protein X767_23710 [Mesorhizobium sp. LSJC264A00]